MKTDDKIKKISSLCIGLVGIIAFILGTGILLETPVYSSFLRRIEHRSIDAASLFYTDTKETLEAENFLRNSR